MANNFLGGQNANQFNNFLYTIEINNNSYTGSKLDHFKIVKNIRSNGDKVVNMGNIFYFTLVFTESTWPHLGSDQSMNRTCFDYSVKRKSSVNYQFCAPTYYYENGTLYLFQDDTSTNQNGTDNIIINYDVVLESYPYYQIDIHPMRNGMLIRSLGKINFTFVDNTKDYRLGLFAVMGHVNLENTVPNPLWVLILTNDNIEEVKDIINSQAITIDFTMPFESEILDAINIKPPYIGNMQIGNWPNRRYGVYVNLSSNLSSLPYRTAYRTIRH